MNVTCEDMIDIAIKAGSIVLENGGETYRTEETVETIANALGAKTASSFVTPTVIQFSYTDNNNHYHSAIRRIKNRTVNLSKIALIDSLKRKIAQRNKLTSSRQIESMLSFINSTKDYSRPLVLFTAGLSSFSFSLMFGGSFCEAVCAFFIGFLLRFFLYCTEKFHLASFFSTLLSGAFISVLTELLAFTGLINDTDNILIAVLMQVVPGLAITNAIRDIISGDLVSGTARLVDAFMIAAGLSIGSVFGMLLFGKLGLAVSENTTQLAAQIAGIQSDAALLASTESVVAAGNDACPALSQNFLYAAKLVCACIAASGAAGFSCFYMNTALRDILYGAFTGSAGWLVFKLTGSYFFASLTVGIVSIITTWITHRPATVFMLPGLLPLVPGGGMFYTMRHAVQGSMKLSASTGFETLTAAGAIAFGIALASSLQKIVSDIGKTKKTK